MESETSSAIPVEVENRNNLVFIDVPLTVRFHCEACQGAPKHFSSHNGLLRHHRNTHNRNASLKFRCRCCKEEFYTLKQATRHVSRNNTCRNETEGIVENDAASYVAQRVRRTRSNSSDSEITNNDTSASRPTNVLPTIPEGIPAGASLNSVEFAEERQEERPLTILQVEMAAALNKVNDPEQFESLLDALYTRLTSKNDEQPAILEQPRPRSQYERRRRNRTNEFDPTVAARLQKLYRRNRKRAYRQVTEENSNGRCVINTEQLFQHFLATYGETGHVTTDIPEVVPTLEAATCDNPLISRFTPDEIWKRLNRCKDTAPGPDGIRYNVWKKIDPGSYIAAAVFNTARRLDYTPRNWNQSETVLIQRKATQWTYQIGGRLRSPIHLGNYMRQRSQVDWRNGPSKTIAYRLPRKDLCHSKDAASIISSTNYCTGCPSKENRSMRGVAGSQKCIRICATLDSVQSFAMDGSRNRIHCYYQTGISECTTKIKSSNGMTEEIPIRAGVKQGCPLSPIIFNLALEPLLRTLKESEETYKVGSQKVNVLAYADDIVLVATSESGLQKLLDLTLEISDWAGLKFNPNKCATLHVDGKNHAASPTKFRLGSNELKSLTSEESYEYLGDPTGFQTFRSAEDVIENMMKHLDRIDKAPLAPWQKFDAVNTFIVPQIEFHLRNGSVAKKALNSYDKKVKKCAKKWANLPQRASAEILYIPYKEGGFNMLPTSVLADIAQIVHATRIMTSRDEALAKSSLDALKEVVRKRTGTEPTTQLMTEYLNSSFEGVLGKPANDITSVWSRVRAAVRRLKMKINVRLELEALYVDDEKVERKNAEMKLRTAARKFYLKQLLAKPDQGKAFDIISAYNSSNHFMRDGKFTRFAEWRFVHRARLNVVPLNGCRRHGQGDKKCRRCGDSNETLPHVLNHCRPHFTTMTKRHDAIVNRLVKAAKKPDDGIIYQNQQIPGYSGLERPDIVIVDEGKKEVKIVDVTVAFENKKAAFEKARAEKIRKYSALAEYFKKKEIKRN
ncbi:uncharacterized protein LOC113383708 [Ctenocephalides felis]|uniref:uncharacterized protein LOC113383708 n=1 Tax=Ctenocephalides felis TaxID=7515 RepID=UPI000E6E58B4|nr:uncharacterized protein LOC113383708 [Ctenocephalides felis]